MVISSATVNQSTSTEHPNRDIETRSSPLSSTKINAIDPAESVTNNDNLQLYVSNIAPDVTLREVEHMVCESIGVVSVLQVKRLISSWQDISTLNYVSYKVTIDAQFRDNALRISNWPSGVRCREFRDFHNSAWRPSTRVNRLSS